MTEQVSTLPRPAAELRMDKLNQTLWREWPTKAQQGGLQELKIREDGNIIFHCSVPFCGIGNWEKKPKVNFVEAG